MVNVSHETLKENNSLTFKIKKMELTTIKNNLKLVKNAKIADSIALKFKNKNYERVDALWKYRDSEQIGNELETLRADVLEFLRNHNAEALSVVTYAEEDEVFVLELTLASIVKYFY